MLEQIKSIKSKHPFWGYRRIWAYLKYRENKTCSKNRIYRVMRESTLLVDKNFKLRAKRKNYPSKPRASFRNEIWGIDMTKVKTNSGWLYIHLVLDWHTKKIVGYNLSSRSRTKEWLEAVEGALNEQFVNDYKQERLRELKLVSDNGCQPTSRAFMKSCNYLEVKQIFTSFNNPKGNADTERVIRTLKEEICLEDWDGLLEAKEEVERVIRDYNYDYPHSKLNYKTPASFDEMCFISEIKEKTA